jgi:hypothetical protein
MEEDGSVIRSEALGVGRFTVPETGLSPEDLSRTTGLCDVGIVDLLARINTRPGPDEEVVVDVKIRKRPIRDQ